MPRVFYGLTRGDQTYRFTEDTELTLTITGEIGTAFEFYSLTELSNDYIPAIAVKTAEDKLKIVVKGDYTAFTGSLSSYSFNIVNMTTGASTTQTMSGVLSLQDASSLLDYPAADNGNKQITVIKSLETNATNVVYASIDYNNDGIFNWIEIGRFVDGRDGYSVYSLSEATYNAIKTACKTGDSLISGEAFTADSYTFAIGGVYAVLSKENWTLQGMGNIRGPQGETGATGQDGADGADGYTPYIQDGYWYINGVNTNVKALGTDGTDGQNGQSFQMQSGLYSTPDNWGENNNVDPDGNPLLQLPTLPQTNITGKGFVVYDPLTTPLAPFYDLYYANNGDTTWTIIHPFSGIAGTNGKDGSTPYIGNNDNWYIDRVDTGVSAVGPQGPAGPGVPSGGTAGQVLKKASNTDYDTTWGAPLDTSNVPSGTINESIGFNANNELVRGSAGGASNAVTLGTETQTFEGSKILKLPNYNGIEFQMATNAYKRFRVSLSDTSTFLTLAHRTDQYITITNNNLDSYYLRIKNRSASNYKEILMSNIATLNDISTKVPDAPTTDGTYTLKVVVTNGTPTYQWVLDT